MRQSDVFGRIPSIPNILQLPFTDPVTDLYQEHGSTALIAMMGRILLQPITGFSEVMFLPEYFWETVEPWILALSRAWETYEEATRAETAVEKNRLGIKAYEEFMAFVYEFSKSVYVNEKISLTDLELFCNICCGDLDAFYKEQAAKAREERP